MERVKNSAFFYNFCKVKKKLLTVLQINRVLVGGKEITTGQNQEPILLTRQKEGVFCFTVEESHFVISPFRAFKHALIRKLSYLSHELFDH